MKITEGIYRGMTCFFLENEVLRAVVLNYGGKFVSVYHRELKHEFLTQPEEEAYRVSSYGSSFSEGAFCGFDDMFPTIDRCIYPVWPHEGSVMPDHGEVWTVPWEVQAEEDGLLLQVHGIRLPYILKKRITMDRETIRIDYSAENQSPCPFSALWAAHPLLNCTENTRLLIKDAKKIINVMDSSTRLGRYGTLHPWPAAVLPDGGEYRMDKICSREVNLCEKYYVYNEIKEGSAAVIDPSGRVTFHFPADKVPYLGVWVDEGGYAGKYHVALEPCTAPMDALDLAMKSGRAVNYAPGEKRDWYLEMTFSEN